VGRKKRSVKQARLDQRAAGLQRQAELDRRNRNIVIAVVVLLIVAGAAALLILPRLGGSNGGGSSPTSLGIALTDEGNAHMPNCPIPPSPGATPVSPEPSPSVTAVPVYLHHPPSSGCHYPVPAPWNVVGVAQTVLEPTYVHNLEHGGIVLIYKCSGTQCADDLRFSQKVQGTLPAESQSKEVKFVATPDQDSPVQCAVLAWARELDLSALDDTALQQIQQFYNLYVDKGGKECQPRCPA
jgi:Protein of unknown function (DUF3105)